MNTIKSYIACLTIFALLFSSCSKEEDSVIDDPNGESATLSFATVLNDMVSNSTSLKQQLEIPDCSDAAPAFVEVVLTGPTNVGSFENPLVVEVNSTPGDYDGDSEAEYFTKESSDLKLQPGTYSLEYFIVYDGDPDDDSSNRLWIAPRNDGEMADFVENALPSSFSLGAGVKKYVDVDVLCFDDRMVNEYGYLFFDIDGNRAIEFCVFGNYCPPSGRHYPAQFSIDVWSYADGVRGAQIHNDLTNEVAIDENGDWAGSTVCMALPDTEGLDEYYFEITLLDSDAYGDIDERIIRYGVLRDDEAKALFVGENNLDYLHFREGCGGDDDPPIFQDPEDDVISYKSCLMPINGSRAVGFAYIDILGDEMKTTIVGMNLETGIKNIQNIYGGDNGGAAACPPSDSDELLMALMDEGGDYPVVADGEFFTWRRTYTLGVGDAPVWAELDPLDNKTVVFKGMTQDGEYDPEVAIACGELFKLNF